MCVCLFACGGTRGERRGVAGRMEVCCGEDLVVCWLFFGESLALQLVRFDRNCCLRQCFFLAALTAMFCICFVSSLIAVVCSVAIIWTLCHRAIILSPKKEGFDDEQ